MANTLADIADQLASSYGPSGICMNSDEDMRKLLAEVNEVIPVLAKRIDAKGTLTPLTTIPVHGGYCWLPYDCLEARAAFFNGCAVTHRDQWYEWQMGSLSECSGRQCGPRDMVDLGDGWAIPFTWPNHHFDSRLGLVAEHDGDAGVKVQVRVKDRYGNETEEFLELPADQQMVETESVVTDVKFFRKGPTKGAIRMYVTYSTGERTLAARYQPRLRVASFRKKKLPQSWGDCDGELTLVAKMRFIPLVSEFDPLPIDDVEALSFGMQALESKRNRDYQAYNSALQLAVNELQRQRGDEQSAGVVSQMVVRSPVGGSRKRFY